MLIVSTRLRPRPIKGGPRPIYFVSCSCRVSCPDPNCHPYILFVSSYSGIDSQQYINNAQRLHQSNFPRLVKTSTWSFHNNYWRVLMPFSGPLVSCDGVECPTENAYRFGPKCWIIGAFHYYIEQSIAHLCTHKSYKNEQNLKKVKEHKWQFNWEWTWKRVYTRFHYQHLSSSD